MPASADEIFYRLLDSAAQTTKDGDAIAQNKRIKEAEFAEDSREPAAEEEEALQACVMEVRRQDEAKRKKKNMVADQ